MDYVESEASGETLIHRRASLGRHTQEVSPNHRLPSQRRYSRSSSVLSGLASSRPPTTLVQTLEDKATQPDSTGS